MTKIAEALKTKLRQQVRLASTYKMSQAARLASSLKKCHSELDSESTSSMLLIDKIKANTRCG